MEIRLQRIEEMLGTLIKMVGENNSRLKTLEEKSDRHDSRLESLEKKTDRLEADVKETKDYAKILMEGLERQDRILEMLSVKSIETDSYIRDFKRRL